MEIVNGRRELITNLIKRETERKSDVEKRREDKNQTLAEHEKIEFFEKSFTERREEIETALKSSLQIHPKQLAAHFDDVSGMISSLQKYVAASNLFLRCYDIKVSHRSLQDLTSKARELEERLLPKKKFGFKNKARGAKPKEVDGINGHSNADEVDSGDKTRFAAEPDDITGFENKRNENLRLHGREILKKDVTLRNLENCTVKLYGSPATVHMNHLKNCLVLCGPVSTSIFAENCTKCKFVIACQQLRLHASVNVDVYLHVTSRAIMEDCNEIAMAPYNLGYENIGQDFEISGLDTNSCNFTSVDDFNWLSKEVPSPNWRVLLENERVSDWDAFVLSTS